MRSLRIIARAAFLLFPMGESTAATKDTLTASELFSICTTEAKQAHEFAEQTCVAYFRGMTDGMAVMQGLRDGGSPTCLPSGAPIDIPRARQIFTDWVRSHPEKGGSSAGLAAAFSIVWAYSCKN